LTTSTAMRTGRGGKARAVARACFRDPSEPLIPYAAAFVLVNPSS
jgi:hypothetical protein